MGEVVVAASGYFDPLHLGHVEYLEKARELGDRLVVIVNNRLQTVGKKGYEFMPFDERVAIVRAIRCVDDVFPSIDSDSSVCKSLEAIRPQIFAKGGDRYSYEIPETRICRELGIRIIDGLGAKIQSSSDLVSKYRSK